MHGAAGRIAARLGQLECFHHHTLSGERSITMNQNWQHLIAGAVIASVLPGAYRTFYDRINDFKVRRVECQGHMDRSGICLDIRGIAEVVFHVTGLDIIDILDIVKGLALEFTKQFGRHLANNINQHIQSSAMCHANDNLGDSGFRTFLHQFIQQRNQTFTTFQRKAFLAGVFCMQILFKRLGCNQPVQYAAFFCLAERGGSQWFFQTVLYPAFLFRLINVHVFDTDITAVGSPDYPEDLLQTDFIRS